MHIFTTLLIKIIPLYLLIVIGYIASKKLNARKETVAPILIYTIVPFIVFNSVISMRLTKELLFLPLIFFILCSFIGLSFYFIGKRLFTDSTRNILAFSAGTGNTGYFGIPVAIELFGDKVLGIMVLGILGFTIYENTLGFFLTAKGQYTTKESLIRLFKLPTIYAFILAVIVNFLGVKFGDSYAAFAKNFIGAYTVLGMMLIGMGLADIKNMSYDFKFVFSTFAAKFIVWPLLTSFIVLLDLRFFNIYDHQTHNIMLLLSIVPLAANSVAFATELNAKPEKAALAVFLSTLFALFFIPIFSVLFFQ
jgi:predicted permease